MREQPVFQPGDEHLVELQALGRMHGHQLHRVLPVLGLVVAGLERRMGQEGGQAVFVFLGEVRGRVDQFVEVFEPLPAFAVGLVVGAQSGMLEHVIDGFRQRQFLDGLAHGIDQLVEGAQRTAGLALQHRHGARQRNACRVGHVTGCRRSAQLFDGTRADAARRKVDHPRKRGVVVGIGEQAQVGDRMLDLGAFEKPQTAVDLVGNAVGEQHLLDHARLRVGPVQHRDLAAPRTPGDQVLDLGDQPASFVEVGAGFEHPHRLAMPLLGPEVLAKALAIVLDQCIGGVQDVAVRAIVLLQLDQVLYPEIAFEVEHVADTRAPEGVDRLVIVPDREHRIRLRGTGAGQQLEPFVLKRVGVLEFVDQNVPEAGAVVLAQGFVAAQHLVGAQQQFGEVDHAFALALVVVGGVQLDETPAVLVAGHHVFRALPGILGAVDEPHQVFCRVFLGVDIERLQQALDRGQLVRRIEDLKQRGQRGFAMVRAQEAVAQAVKGTDPHAAQVDRQHRRQAMQHLARRLVGEGDAEDVVRAHLPGLDQPGDAGGENAGLAGSGTGQDQGRLIGKGDGLELFRIEVFENIGH